MKKSSLILPNVKARNLKDLFACLKLGESRFLRRRYKISGEWLYLAAVRLEDDLLIVACDDKPRAGLKAYGLRWGSDHARSSRVKSQAPTTSKVTSTQGFRSLTIAFNIPNIFRIHATKATIFAFPASTRRSYTTCNAGLWRIAERVPMYNAHLTFARPARMYRTPRCEPLLDHKTHLS